MAANLESGFFRLILLSPGQWDDEISCTLIPFNRFRDTYPPYKALSYVWGRWSRTPPKIRVNGRKVRVTTNLAVALRHLRHGEVDMALWIDALCIDQSNTDERSSQVAQMRDIYSTAVEVIMFLGSGLDYGVSSNHHSSRDLRPLHIFDGGKHDFLLASQYIVAWKTSPLKKPVQALEVFAFLTIMSWSKNSPNLLGVLEGIPESHMAALAESLRRTLLAPWWDRIWVVQEAVVASKLTVRYGNVTIPWELLVGAAETLSDWESIHAKNPSSLSTTDLKVFNLSSRILYLNSFRTQWFQSGGTNLLLLLKYFGSRRASDERDRVYALIGLCNEATIFRPDYSLQVAEVYMEPVLVAIRNTKSLHVLIGDHSRKGRQDIPSWVPDWSAERDEIERRRIELSALYDACKGVKLLLTTENGSVLELVRDSMNSLLDRLKAEQDPRRLLKKEYVPLLRRLSRISLLHSPFNRLKIGLICDELAMYCHEDGRRDFPKYSMIIQNGRSLRIVGRKIGTVSKTTEPLYESPNVDTALSMLGEWKQVAQARSVEYEEKNFVRTIFSDLMKNPSGFLGRLQRDGGFVPGGDAIETLIQVSQDYDRFSDVIRLSTTKRAMFFINYVDINFFARYGNMGIGPMLMKEGDEVYILPGSRMPLVLRPESCGDWGPRYRLIGDCFIQGVMDGELGLYGFDILTLDDNVLRRVSWKGIIGECEQLASGNGGTPAAVGELLALEIV